ncbi:MAG: cell division protein ZapA [Pseudomonadales bacterium]|nr:cell division protein ZapA [Pseudomonadales bacterium]
MSKDTVTVRILDRDYQVSCPSDEQESLLASARYLDQQMRSIKSAGVIGLERIAVMAALNIAHELLTEGSTATSNRDDLKRLTDKISQALGGQSQLQL